MRSHKAHAKSQNTQTAALVTGYVGSFSLGRKAQRNFMSRKGRVVLDKHSYSSKSLQWKLPSLVHKWQSQSGRQVLLRCERPFCGTWPRQQQFEMLLLKASFETPRHSLKCHCESVNLCPWNVQLRCFSPSSVACGKLSLHTSPKGWCCRPPMECESRTSSNGGRPAIEGLVDARWMAPCWKMQHIVMSMRHARG